MVLVDIEPDEALEKDGEHSLVNVRGARHTTKQSALEFVMTKARFKYKMSLEDNSLARIREQCHSFASDSSEVELCYQLNAVVQRREEEPEAEGNIAEELRLNELMFAMHCDDSKIK